MDRLEEWFDELAAWDFSAQGRALYAGVRALASGLNDLENRGEKLREGLRERLLLSGAEERLALLDEVEALDEDRRACQWQIYALTADAIGTHYTAADVAYWCQRAEEMGACHPKLGWRLLDNLLHVRKVPNAPFRERYDEALRQGYDEAHIVRLVHRHLRDVELEEAKDFGSKNLVIGKHPQARVLRRWLGAETQASNSGKGSSSLTVFIPYERAVALARALDLPPHTVGI